MQEEQGLVARAQQYDEGAFAQLYERYFEKIFRYISLKIGDKFEAEDMAQQVFLKALKSIESFKWKDVPFSAWLYRIAHNLTVDYLRRKTRRPTSPLEEVELYAEEPNSNIQKDLEFRFDLERLSSAMGQLTEAQREVLSLRFTSELPIAAVAQIMGKSEGAVKSLQHSAVLALRRIMTTG